MRVRISYGIDLADAPAKTAKLVEEALEELSSKVDMLHKGMFLLENESLIDSAPEWLDKTRQGMNDADQILADAHAIISGYVEVKTKPEQIPTPQNVSSDPAQPAEEAPDVRKG